MSYTINEIDVTYGSTSYTITRTIMRSTRQVYMTPVDWKWYTKWYEASAKFICLFSNATYKVINPDTEKVSMKINSLIKQKKWVYFLANIYAWWNNKYWLKLEK